MKTTTSAAIVALTFGLGLAAVPAFAADYGQGRDRNDQPAAQDQDQNDQGNDKDRGRHKGQHKDDNNAPAPYGQEKNDKSNYNQTNAPGGDNDRDRTRSNRTNTDYNNNDNNRDRGDRDRGDRDSNDRDRSYDNNNRYNGGDRWRDRDRSRTNFNINIYRRNMHSPRRFHIGIYNAPRGYYYRRWHYGERLPISFWRRDYWLLDYIAFGLFAPPPGYVWVRYGPDALLIDTYTGEIIQVRYDVFYS